MAWLIVGELDSTVWKVFHGSRVETHEQWFGEIIWNGNFLEANFDQTDVVFGSGAKIVESDLVLVASSNTLDRLVSFSGDNKVVISNSLVCLSQFLNADFCAWYPDYPGDFKSIIAGPDDHVETIPSSHGPIRITYFYNLRLRGGRLERQAKPIAQRNRETFDEYESFLTENLERLIANAQSPCRKYNWKLMGTLSSGFDSTTAAALTSKLGLEEAITVRNSRGGGYDCGTPIGKALGLHVHEFERDVWQKRPFSEIPFLAADAKGEDVYFCAAEPMLRGRIVFTGFSGSIWGGYSRDYIHLKRTDQSGLSLTEYRLHADMINVAVPSIGVYHGEDLLKLMQSTEAQNWATGAKYDKPFCRKVLTSSGVAPELLGKQKQIRMSTFEPR